MQATLKYFWVVIVLIVVQVIMGVVTAHYGVEGTAFYGFPLAEFLPYSLSRTWHVQIAIFWIATSWLRVIGGTLFAIGILALGWFVVGLKTGWSLKEEEDISEEHYPTARQKASV